MIKRLLFIHTAVTLLLTGVVSAFGTMHHAINCLLAGLLVGANLSVVIWTAKNIFQKKSVALAGSIIVIKYAVLISMFVILSKIGWQLDYGFALGLSAMFPSIGYMAYKQLTTKELSRADGTF